LLLCACIIWQFIGFSLMYWTQQPYERHKAEWTWLDEGRARLQHTPRPPLHNAARNEEALSPVAPTSAPATTSTSPAASPDDRFYPGTERSRQLNIREQWDTTYTMVVPVTQLLALISVASQVIIVFITLLVILVAQAPGVAQITRSLIWSVLLLFMILPWQYFARDFPIPGVIYGYNEMLRSIGRHVTGESVSRFDVVVVYLRFVVWPVVGLLVLLIMSERFRAGIMLAIGHPLQSLLQPRGPKPVAPLLNVGVPVHEKRI